MTPEDVDPGPTDGGGRPVLVCCDVDGVTSPVHGESAWCDDVEVGDVFDPVVVSPTLVAHLDGLAAVPGVVCLWMTDWTPEMRERMKLFPGRDWPMLQPANKPVGSRSWWKFAALQAWLTDLAATVPEETFFGSVVCAHDLRCHQRPGRSKRRRGLPRLERRRLRGSRVSRLD